MTTIAQEQPTTSIRWVNGWFLPVAFSAALFVVSVGLGVKALAALIICGVLAIVMCGDASVATVLALSILYSNIAVVAYHVHGVSAAVAGSFVILFAVPLLHTIIQERESVRTNGIVPLMCWYAVALLASAAFSADVSASWSRILTFVSEGLILYIVIINVVIEKKVLRKAILTLVVVGAMLASFSLYQKLTGDFSTKFWGLANTDVVDTDTGEAIPPKVAGPIGDRNYYGQILVVLLPLGLFLGRSEKNTPKRRAIWCATALILAAALLTYSRGTTITILTILVWLCWRRYLPFWKVAAFAAVAVVLLAVSSPEYIARMATLTRNISTVSSSSMRSADISARGRLTENIAAAKVFLANPIFGVGPGQAPAYISKAGNEGGFRRLAGARHGHNLYLEELADTGLVGFGILAAIIVSTLAMLRREMAASIGVMRELLPGIYFSIAAFLVSAIFLQLSFERYFWLIMAMGAAAVQIATAEREREW